MVAVVAIERRRSGCYHYHTTVFIIYFFIFCAMIDDRSLSFGKEKDF